MCFHAMLFTQYLCVFVPGARLFMGKSNMAPPQLEASLNRVRREVAQQEPEEEHAAATNQK